MKPYSQRYRPQPDSLSYEIPVLVRGRIVHTLSQLFVTYRAEGFNHCLLFILDKCHAQYGGIYQGGPVGFSGLSGEEQIINHFQGCETEHALDFIEWFFQAPYCAITQAGVDAVNEIFREEGIGYELTPFSIQRETLDGGGVRVRIAAHPEVIKKSNDPLYQATVLPALKVLTNAIFDVANKEMLEAHQCFREGKFGKAIVACGQAIESVLKIICHEKKWAYKPDIDTLGVLTRTVTDNKLFHDFYKDVLTSSGTIRNRMGAHGKATTAYPPATEEYAEHMIGITSANIVFVARLAGLA